MKKKIIWFIIFTLLVIILIIASIFINKKGIEYIQGSQNISNVETTINEKEENSMYVKKVNDETFEQEVLKSNIPVLVDFYADWCGPCKMLSPTVDEVAQENDDIKVVKVNVDESQNTAIKYQVMSIPTLVVIKNGNEVNRSVGVIDKEEVFEAKIVSGLQTLSNSANISFFIFIIRS